MPGTPQADARDQRDLIRSVRERFTSGKRTSWADWRTETAGSAAAAEGAVVHGGPA
jgi:hypothetical protein